MLLDTYPVIIGKEVTVFEFVSEGSHGRIMKMIVFSETHIHHFFNLGFGDKDERTGLINDESITNNGDSVKILATVASTVYIFTQKFPEAVVFATGTTRSRTRLYRMGISNHLHLIQNDFEVFGFSNGDWEIFQKNTDYDAFLVKRKKN